MSRISTFLFPLIAALMPAVALAQVTDGEALPPIPEQPPDPVSSSLLDGMLLMSSEAMIMLVAGVILSFVTSVLVKQAWSDDIKAGIYFAICIVFGLVYTLTLDEWNTADAGRRILLVLVAGTLFYQLFKGPMQAVTTRSDGFTSGLTIGRK